MPQKHTRPPTQEELEVLELAQAAPSRIALMPVVFNGEQRFALVIRCMNSEGEYVRMLGVLPVADDRITNGEGIPGRPTPPVSKSDTN